MGWKFDEMLDNEINQKVRKRPKHEEDRLEADCVRWFDTQHKADTLLLHHSPNEGKRSDREGSRNRTLGTRKGFPDLILLHSHRDYDYLAIELKTPGGKLSPEQKAYQKALNMSGGCYIIIRDLGDFIQAVTDWYKNKDMTKWIDNK